MGDVEIAPLRLQFNPKVRLELHGATITTEGGDLGVDQRFGDFTLGSAMVTP
ncbi:MAG: hypothetical protein O2913_12155 [Chloroflexi bacterium]|nr:hypothetical protein [Chloroflexota bacterium]